MGTRHQERPEPGGEDLEQWVAEAGALVSPPDVCIRIFELLEDDRVSASRLGDVIARDPALTARLLRIVNSPFYGFTRRIDTVSRAVAVIGASELHTLVVAAAARTSFARIPNFIVNIDTFWRHGIGCGVLARELARRCRILHPERLFVAGLMHDLGSLVFYQREPDIMRGLLLDARGDETLLARHERHRFGFDHAELGARLLDRWQLPATMVQAIRFHHEPARAADSALEAAIVHVADAIANHEEDGAFYASPSARLLTDGSAWRLLGLEPDPALVADVVAATREAHRVAVELFG